MTQTKICTRCKQDKPLSEFGKASHCKDGLKYDCKTCVAIDFRRYRERKGPEFKAAINEANKRINKSTQKQAVNKGMPWSKQEDDFVREFWTTESGVEIGKALGRTYLAVNARGKFLGLRKRHDSRLTDTSLSE